MRKSANTRALVRPGFRGMASGIDKRVVSNPTPRNTVGNVANANVETGLYSLVLRWTSDPAKRTCIIGDPDNLIASAFSSMAVGGAFVDPTSMSSPDVTSWKRSLAGSPVTIQQINIKTSNEFQLDNNFTIAYADHNGMGQFFPIHNTVYERNNQDIKERLTLKLRPEEYITLNNFRGIFFDLEAATTITLTLSIAYAAGRA